MKDAIKRLWWGELPLAHVFWNYAIIYGSLLNFATTIAALAALSMDMSPALALALHFLSLPYNVAVVVGTWRSAGRYSGAEHWASLARGAVVIWAVVATIA